VAGSSFLLLSAVSIVIHRLCSIVVVCVNVCVVVCIACRLRYRQLHRSKHSGDRRRMLGMDITMDRANLVRKDIKPMQGTADIIMKWGALRQQMTWQIFGKNMQQAVKSKQNQQERGYV
jgi:hypothetical protein